MKHNPPDADAAAADLIKAAHQQTDANHNEPRNIVTKSEPNFNNQIVKINSLHLPKSKVFSYFF